MEENLLVTDTPSESNESSNNVAKYVVGPLVAVGIWKVGETVVRKIRVRRAAKKLAPVETIPSSDE